MLASVTVAFLGIGLAWLLYQRHPEVPARVGAAVGPAYRLVYNKYYVDELYGLLFVRGLALGGGKTLHAVDRFAIDGGDGEVRPGLGVNGIGWAVREGVAKVSDFLDRWVVDGAVNLTAAVLDNLSYVFRSLQNGLVQHYALSMLIIILFMIGIGSRYIL
jgi:NADH:ubiquinone oxidoreductase subunit 5 (subunit L)/multisubunit Na+/H+ antiporter MnhA subunit